MYKLYFHTGPDGLGGNIVQLDAERDSDALALAEDFIAAQGEVCPMELLFEDSGDNWIERRQIRAYGPCLYPEDAPEEVKNG